MVSYFNTVQFPGSSTAKYIAISPSFSLDVFGMQRMKFDKKGEKKSFVETCVRTLIMKTHMINRRKIN